jgi:hypothetical protein
LRVAAQQLVARLGIAPEGGDGVGQVAFGGEQRVLGEVVGQHRGLLEEQRQVVLDARGHAAGANVLVNPALGRVALEHLAEAAPEQRAAGLVQRELARRQQPHVAHLVDAPLGVDVEGTDGLDLVVEQVDAVGNRRAHGEDVDQPAAHAVLARRHHLRDVRVARHGQLLAERLGVEARALLEEEGVGRQVGPRRQAHQRRGHRHQQRVHLTPRQQVERLEPL